MPGEILGVGRIWLLAHLLSVLFGAANNAGCKTPVSVSYEIRTWNYHLHWCQSPGSNSSKVSWWFLISTCYLNRPRVQSVSQSTDVRQLCKSWSPQQWNNTLHQCYWTLYHPCQQTWWSNLLMMSPWLTLIIFRNVRWIEVCMFSMLEKGYNVSRRCFKLEDGIVVHECQHGHSMFNMREFLC